MSNLITGLTGIIASCIPVMDGDERAMWVSEQYGDFYKWEVTIGDKTGSALSKEAEPWWKKTGVAVEYTLEDKSNGNYGFKAFKKPKSPDAQKAHIKEAYGEKVPYNDPKLLHQLALTQAMELTVKLFKEINYAPKSVDQLNQHYDYLYGWIMKGCTTRDEIWLRSGCLKAAMEALPWLNVLFPGEEKTVTKLIRLADSNLLKANQVVKDNVENKAV